MAMTTKEKLTVWGGGGLLTLLILSGWFPRSCPLLHQVLSPCPDPNRVANDSRFLSAEEADLQRIPHFVIDRDLVEFEVKAQDYRKTTDVKFFYQGDLSHQVAHLGIRQDNRMHRIALVTHPLLIDLDWQRYSVTQPNETLYQRDQDRFASIADVRNNLPPAQELAVDEIIAREWGLDPRRYQALESLTSLDGISTILTTYIPPKPDGNWFLYEQTFDTTDYFVDAQGNLEWQVFLPNVTSGKVPFRMSSVTINYRSMH